MYRATRKEEGDHKVKVRRWRLTLPVSFRGIGPGVWRGRRLRADNDLTCLPQRRKLHKTLVLVFPQQDNSGVLVMVILGRVMA
jgi:hypothetical protein